VAHPAQRQPNMMAVLLSSGLTIARMSMFIVVYASTDSWLGKVLNRFIKKEDLMLFYSFENCPDLLLPPCILTNKY